MPESRKLYIILVVIIIFIIITSIIFVLLAKSNNNNSNNNPPVNVNADVNLVAGKNNSNDTLIASGNISFYVTPVSDNLQLTITAPTSSVGNIRDASSNSGFIYVTNLSGNIIYSVTVSGLTFVYTYDPNNPNVVGVVAGQTAIFAYNGTQIQFIQFIK